jgi:uncharacterized protein (TIGR03083 family)
MTKQAVAALGDEQRLVLDLIGSLSPAEWEAASDCAGWRVQDVVAHMSAVYKSIAGGPVASDPDHPGDAERGADAGVNERRSWSSADVAAEYREWSDKGIAALAGMNEEPMASTVIPLGNLGQHPMHILANALVFDHYCHLRWDLLRPHGPLERAALPSDDHRMAPIMEWMLGGLPQMCAAGLAMADRPLNLVFEGAGGGTWAVRPATPFVTITPGTADDAAATVTSTAHDFVCWGTARRRWRDMGVRVSGDEHYAARFLDTVNVI